jgi:hypothetical protein
MQLLQGIHQSALVRCGEPFLLALTYGLTYNISWFRFRLGETFHVRHDIYLSAPKTLITSSNLLRGIDKQEFMFRVKVFLK